MKFPSVVFAVLLSVLTVRAFGFPSFMSSSSTLTTDTKSDDPKPSGDTSKTTKHTDTEPECASDSGNKSEFLGFGDSNPSPAPPGKTGKAPAATKSQLVDESEDSDEKASMFGREDSKFFGKDEKTSMFGSDEASNKSELFGGSNDEKCKFFGKDKNAKMFGGEDSKFFGKDEKTSMFGSDEDGSKSELFGGSSDKSNKPTFSEDSTSADDEALTKE